VIAQATPTPFGNGPWIAYQADGANGYGVQLLPLDGGHGRSGTVAGLGGYQEHPDWAPDGRNVAFQSQLAGQFQIMTISLRDRSVKQHTSESTNEDPSWAPDGRHLVFTSTRTGVKQLWVLDTESGRVRQLTRSGGARLAAWSSRLAAR